MSEKLNPIPQVNLIEIADPEDPTVKYEFKVPGNKLTLQVNMRARAIRRQNDPSGVGDLVGLDQETAMLAWANAAFELLLVSSGAKWPYTPGQDGKPVVDYAQFPDEKIYSVLYIGYKLDAEIARFREKWTANWKPTGQENVDGGVNPGAQEPVSG